MALLRASLSEAELTRLCGAGMGRALGCSVAVLRRLDFLRQPQAYPSPSTFDLSLSLSLALALAFALLTAYCSLFTTYYLQLPRLRHPAARSSLAPLTILLMSR